VTGGTQREKLVPRFNVQGVLGKHEDAACRGLQEIVKRLLKLGGQREPAVYAYQRLVLCCLVKLKAGAHYAVKAAGNKQHNGARPTIEGGLVQAVKADIHHSRKPAFHEEVAAFQVTHKVAH